MRIEAYRDAVGRWRCGAVHSVRSSHDVGLQSAPGARTYDALHVIQEHRYRLMFF